MSIIFTDLWKDIRQKCGCLSPGYPELDAGDKSGARSMTASEDFGSWYLDLEPGMLGARDGILVGT